MTMGLGTQEPGEPLYVRFWGGGGQYPCDPAIGWLWSPGRVVEWAGMGKPGQRNYLPARQMARGLLLSPLRLRCTSASHPGLIGWRIQASPLSTSRLTHPLLAPLPHLLGLSSNSTPSRPHPFAHVVPSPGKWVPLTHSPDWSLLNFSLNFLFLRI